MAWLYLDPCRTRAWRSAIVDGASSSPVKLITHTGRPKSWLSRIASSGPYDGVAIVAGPGTFSSVRIGVLYANMIAKLQGIPLVSVEPIARGSRACDCAATWSHATRSTYVAPVYDAEPNITQPV